MKIVNTTKMRLYRTALGNLLPMKATSDSYRGLEKELNNIVNMCGTQLGVILNDNEKALIDKLMSLDERGENFKPSAYKAPVHVPASAMAQENELRKDMSHAKESAVREAIINGEIDENTRTPVGPGTMRGEKVDPSSIKTGFSRILEENAKIASKKETLDPNEALDPIGAHMKRGDSAEVSVDDPSFKVADAQPIANGNGVDGDATKSANVDIPKNEVSERAGAMDRKAAEMSRQLSHIGPEPAKETIPDGDGEVQDPPPQAPVGDVPPPSAPEQDNKPEEPKKRGGRRSRSKKEN